VYYVGISDVSLSSLLEMDQNQIPSLVNVFPCKFSKEERDAEEVKLIAEQKQRLICKNRESAKKSYVKRKTDLEDLKLLCQQFQAKLNCEFETNIGLLRKLSVLEVSIEFSL
jgi:hypothetical protein